MRGTSRPGAAFRAMAMLLLLWAGARIWLTHLGAPAAAGRPDPMAAASAARARVEPKPLAQKSVATPMRLHSTDMIRPGLLLARARKDEDGAFDRLAPLPSIARADADPRFVQPSPAPLVLSSAPPSFAPSSTAAPVPQGQGHWLVYSYVHWRPGGAGGTSAAVPTYGGSQMFARLTYRIGRDAETSRVAIYGRHSDAIERRGEAEQALGIELQPIKGVPLRLHAERRFRERRPGATALFASGGGNIAGLPFGSRLSIYGQAGALVDGPDGLLAFYDGQAEWTKPVADIPGGRLHLGAKLSGGGQGRDGRLDFGPMAAGEIAWGNRQIRIEAGWRERVAGNAEPGGGPAVTLAAGF